MPETQGIVHLECRNIHRCLPVLAEKYHSPKTPELVAVVMRFRRKGHRRHSYE